MNSNTVSIPIKFRLTTGNSCRRARIEIPLAMSAVTRKLSTCFPELKSGQFSIKYKDEEGDEIEVVNDADLAEAMAVSNAIGRVLSFTVCPASMNSASASSGDSDKSDDAMQHGDHWQKHWQKHWRAHGGRHGRHGHGHHGHYGRRWHALAHMLGMRPQEMKPQMQDMMRFGMLKHFVGDGNVETHSEGFEDLKCTFVSDMTYVDGAVLQPNQMFNKKWLVKTGAKAWPVGCTLVHVGGHPMGTRRRKHPKFTLGAVTPNSEIEVMVVLQAPKRSRDFVSKWRMCTPDGQLFGDFLWANIRVERTATTVVEIDLECKFVADGSIPDGTTMQPNQQFDKKWVVKTGKTAWPAGCTLIHVSGNAFGTKRRMFKPEPLGEVSADTEVVLKVTMQAPKRAKNFISKWRMCAPDGRQFGDHLWTFVSVEQPAPKPSGDTGLQCSFVLDGTIPDRSSLPPKQWFEKKWMVKTGPKPWPAGCVLTHVGGHAMGTKNSKAKPAPLGPVAANSEVELVVGLKTPKPARDFVSKWRMCTPEGRQFGDFLWALITVDRDAPAAPPVATKPAAASVVVTKPTAASVVATKPAAASVVVTKPAAAAPPVATKPAAATAVATKPLAASAVPDKVDATSVKLQKLLELNFPVPVEVLAHVLESTGGNLHAAIGVLLAQ